MKLTTSTAVLQTMVAKAVKGASCNKMIPLTSLMAIELKDGKLTLLTSDATNYLYIKQDKVMGDDFYVVVQIDTFAKLIARMTCENITLELKENCLSVKGNGTYSLDLPLNEDGELIRFPNPLAKFDVSEDASEVNLSTIKIILNTAKAALSDSLDTPCYTGYYLGGNIVSTDTYKICGINISLFDKPCLVSAEMMNLLDVMDNEKIKVIRTENNLVFDTPNCTVYGKPMSEIVDYQIEAINGLINQEFSSSCKLSKSALLQLLDRLILFVSPYDKNGIYLTFTRDGLQIESKQANSVEIISYSESSNFVDYTCCIDIEMFRSQVKANTGDCITIQYGEDNAIKMVDGNITQVIALLDDDRMAE